MLVDITLARLVKAVQRRPDPLRRRGKLRQIGKQHSLLSRACYALEATKFECLQAEPQTLIYADNLQMFADSPVSWY